MSILSRRNVLLGSISILAIGGGFLYPQIGLSTTTLNFSDDKEKPIISFVEASKTLAPYVDSMMERAEKDFGVKYSIADRQRIHTRMWDKVHLVLLEAYRPKEAAQ
jgi:hypothetical protein